MTYYIRRIKKEHRMMILSKRVSVIFLIALILLNLAGCKKPSYTLIVPSGSPEFGLAYLKENSAYEVTTVSGAEALTAAFNDIGYDIIIAPVNLGAKLFNAKPLYQLIGVLTWGNYYLISKDPINLDDITTLDIVAFGQNQIPDMMLKYILAEKGITPNISYLDGVTDIPAAYLLDDNKVYLIAEPSLSILNQTTPLYIIDIQDAYQDITGITNYPQAGVFVHHDMSDEAVSQLITAIEQSITNIITKSDAHDLLTRVGISIDEAIYLDAFNRSNIDFKSSIDEKDTIIAYFNLIYQFNPNFIGTLPSDDFYRG